MGVEGVADEDADVGRHGRAQVDHEAAALLVEGLDVEGERLLVRVVDGVDLDAVDVEPELGERGAGGRESVGCAGLDAL